MTNAGKASSHVVQVSNTSLATYLFIGVHNFKQLTSITGNHAQGVALSGARLGIPCTIVMPSGTPSIKVRNVARLGAKVVLHGADFDEAKGECASLAGA